MANYFVSYDLNGKNPTHAAMDVHLKKLGKCTIRVLETVWYVRYAGSLKDLHDYVDGIVSKNDRTLVFEASNAMWRNLLCKHEQIQDCWEA